MKLNFHKINKEIIKSSKVTYCRNEIVNRNAINTPSMMIEV